MTIEERIATLESENKSQNEDIKTIAGDIKEIKDKLLNRPSWSVSAIITLLTGLCIGLTTYVLAIK